MKEEYTRLFEKVAPRMSDDELLKSVLNSGKAYNMENNNKNTSTKKSRKIAPAIAAVAAAAALATTAGAVTSYYRNVNEEYTDVIAPTADVFKQAYTDKDGNELDMKGKAEASGMYEELNIELHKTFKCEDFTFEVPGAISDGKKIFIMYDIIFNEDPWSGEHPWFKENENVYLDGMTDCAEIYWGGDLGQGTVSKRGGKTVYSSYLDLDGLENCTSDTLKVFFNNVWGSSYESGDHYFGAELEIPLSDDLKKFNKTIDIPNAPYVKLARWGNWDLTQVEITPLSVTFNMETDGETPDPSVCKFYAPKIPACVKFNDDTTLELRRPYDSNGIDTENKTLKIKVGFNYPIDVDEVQSIQFASAEVDMNGGVTELDTPEIPMEKDWWLDQAPQK